MLGVNPKKLLSSFGGMTDEVVSHSRECGGEFVKGVTFYTVFLYKLSKLPLIYNLFPFLFSYRSIWCSKCFKYIVVSPVERFFYSIYLFILPEDHTGFLTLFENDEYANCLLKNKGFKERKLD